MSHDTNGLYKMCGRCAGLLINTSDLRTRWDLTLNSLKCMSFRTLFLNMTLFYQRYWASRPKAATSWLCGDIFALATNETDIGFKLNPPLKWMRCLCLCVWKKPCACAVVFQDCYWETAGLILVYDRPVLWKIYGPIYFKNTISC